MGLILDSSVFVAAERRGDSVSALTASLWAALGDQEYGLSVVTAAELLHGCWRAVEEDQRSQRQRFVEAVLVEMHVVPLDLEIARVVGRVDAELAAAGEPLPAKDLWIAATALSRGDDVVTGNVKHFQRVPGLTVRKWD